MKKTNKKINFKAEMSSEAIIGVILLIAGFVLIIMIYTSLNLEDTKNKEVCHNSIVLRASTPSALNLREAVPLSCYTEKICIRGKEFLSDAKCSEFEGVEKVKYENVKETQDIEKLIADQIVDCWSMTGEGKVSLFSQYWAKEYGIMQKVYPTCIICSRIAFNETSLKKEKIEMENMDVLGYMMTHKIPTKEISYFNYLAGEGGKMSVREPGTPVNIAGITEKKDEQEKSSLETTPPETIETGAQFSESQYDELAILFMQISAPSHTGVIKNSLSVIGISFGTAFFFKPVTVLKTVWNLLKSPYFWAMMAIVGAYQQGSVAYNRAVSAGYCGDISVGAEARDGCSVVRTVNYNLDDIKKYCSVVESIP